jgi:hypothetical protein
MLPKTYYKFHIIFGSREREPLLAVRLLYGTTSKFIDAKDTGNLLRQHYFWKFVDS